MINKENLKNFLKEAKINTYAGIGEVGEKILGDRGKKFEYVKNNFYYRDIYFGFNPFIGEEIVFFRKKPIWGMNYYSEIIAGHVSAMIIYAFLKKALKKVPKNKPFRGPDNFNDKNFEYINTVKGTIKKCIGKEKIFYNKKLVYILNYCGGIIKEKN
ncbi:MAG: Transcriptional regulator, XRE family [Parcubacteria group bacterium GW2011_GWA2_38_13]|nr:MAG: Transcriptional regulator, XRE family [Parcubacteria group bacterium GW2011_GWA2_38_13]